MIVRGATGLGRAIAKTPVGKRAVNALSGTRAGKGLNRAYQKFEQARQSSIRKLEERLRKARSKNSPWSSAKDRKPLSKNARTNEWSVGASEQDPESLDAFDESREMVLEAARGALDNIKPKRGLPPKKGDGVRPTRKPKPPPKRAAPKPTRKPSQPVKKKMAGGIVKKEDSPVDLSGARKQMLQKRVSEAENPKKKDKRFQIRVKKYSRVN
jgi:hypothetical protein